MSRESSGLGWRFRAEKIPDARYTTSSASSALGAGAQRRARSFDGLGVVALLVAAGLHLFVDHRDREDLRIVVQRNRIVQVRGRGPLIRTLGAGLCADSRLHSLCRES